MTAPDAPRAGELKALIARLEAAREGSRELDAAIIAALVGGAYRQSPFNGAWCVYRGIDRSGEPRIWQPTRGGIEQKLSETTGRTDGLTSSIDAALTLLEPEWDYEIQRLQQTNGICHVRVWQGALGDLVEYDGIIAHAPLPALALCIAALRARSVP